MIDQLYAGWLLFGAIICLNCVELLHVLQSYRAYRKWVEVNGEEALLPGLNMTHEQVTIVFEQNHNLDAQ